MEQGPDFRHYESFIAVAEECSFRKAAEKLHITQPALSGHIKVLEEWLGQDVFKRAPSGSELTEAGRNLLVYARYMLHLRSHAKKASSREHSAAEWPLRLGYSPFINHMLIEEALTGYNEIVPDGRMNSSSDCTGHLIEMLEDGRLDAAILTLPIYETPLVQQVICKDRVVICLREDDPLAKESQIPKSVIADRLRIMFERSYHPLLHDEILKSFKKFGITLNPTETFSAPSEMQFLVRQRGCFGLVREGIPLEPGLVALPMEGISLRFTNALVFSTQQDRPILPMLAYRMTQRCARRSTTVPKKPVQTVSNPSESQAEAFEQCWRKDWQDKEPHLLPAKHVAAWIQANLYLSLADAPFDREDPTLNPAAGACVTCPRRSGHNTSLFCDVQGDQCLDSACYHGKVEAFLDREIAAHPGLVQIENGWRNPKEQRPGAVQRGHVRELETLIDNPDAEPVMPCEAAKPAIVVYGKQLGRKLTVCTDKHCPVHDAQAAAEAAAHPVPIMSPAPEVETEEEAAQREAEHEQRMAEYKAEQERKEEERKAEFERQQKEFEAEQACRDKQRKARVATFERIIEQAPASFNPAQMRVFLRLLIHLDYSFLEEVANHFANGDENSQQSDDEIVLAALGGTADEKLTGLALRLVLSDHVGIPHESQPDLLSEAEQVFAPKKPKVAKARTDGSNQPKPTAAKVMAKKETTRKKAA